MQKYSTAMALIITATWLVAPAVASSIVQFETGHRILGSLTSQKSLQLRKPEQIRGYLSTPAGDQKRAAIVLLPGCGGLAGGRLETDVRIRNWVEKLLGFGYVTLVVDSLATRGLTNTCAGGGEEFRIADAFGALLFLSRQPMVNAERIALFGFSAGGAAALSATEKREGDLYQEQSQLKFKSVIAIYPAHCAVSGLSSTPTLILIGDRDDWSPVATCRRMAEAAPKVMSMIIYPKGHHDFDDPSLAPGTKSFGHWREYNPEAAQKAAGDVARFLQLHLSQ